MKVLKQFALEVGFLFAFCTAVRAQSRPFYVTDPSTAASEPGPDLDELSELPITHPFQPSPDPVSKRLFGILPNYRADQATDTYKPLTTAEKFTIARKDSFDWPNFFLLAGFAAEAQVGSGGFKDRDGVAGFGKFYARSFGDQIIGSYLTEAVMPSLLHEDPRYFRLGVGTVRHRSYYAVSRIFVTRKDNGSFGFNVSEIAGNAGVIAITSSYYPESQSAAEGAQRFGMQLGNDAISNLLTEFWPDIKHRLRFRQHYFFPR